MDRGGLANLVCVRLNKDDSSWSAWFEVVVMCGGGGRTEIKSGRRLKMGNIRRIYHEYLYCWHESILLCNIIHHYNKKTLMMFFYSVSLCQLLQFTAALVSNAIWILTKSNLNNILKLNIRLFLCLNTVDELEGTKNNCTF